MTESPTKNTSSKPAGAPGQNAGQAFRATAENGAAQAKEGFEKMQRRYGGRHEP